MESSGLGNSGANVELYDDPRPSGCNASAADAGDCYDYDSDTGSGIFSWAWASTSASCLSPLYYCDQEALFFFGGGGALFLSSASG